MVRQYGMNAIGGDASRGPMPDKASFNCSKSSTVVANFYALNVLGPLGNWPH